MTPPPTSSIANLVSVLVLKRSILTEKVARRGFHVLRKYSVGALDALFVRDVMETDVVTVEADRSVAVIHASVERRPVARRQRLLPVVDGRGSLLGAIPWVDVLERVASVDGHHPAAEIMVRDLVVAHLDETLREVAERMAQHQVGVMPVVVRGAPGRQGQTQSSFPSGRADAVTVSTTSVDDRSDDGGERSDSQDGEQEGSGEHADRGHRCCRGGRVRTPVAPG